MSEYINVNRVEYIVTYQCTSQCIHCHIDKKHPHSPKEIDSELAVHLLQEVAEQYTLDSVMTFGGEPLLYPEPVCAIHHAAKALNIPKRQLITNGYWTKHPQETISIAESLAHSGVNQVSISVDAFHQEYVPLHQVKQTVTALLDTGIRNIKWNPCWLVSEHDNNAYNLKTRDILEELKDLSIPAGDGNVVEPEGRARTSLRDYFHPLPAYEWYHRSCQEIPYMNKLDDIRTICLEPNGDISLCRGFLLGNTRETPIHTLLNTYNPYTKSDMRLILQKGVQGVVKIARSLGIAFRKDGYYSLCDVCTSLKQDINRQQTHANEIQAKSL